MMTIARKPDLSEKDARIEWLERELGRQIIRSAWKYVANNWAYSQQADDYDFFCDGKNFLFKHLCEHFSE